MNDSNAVAAVAVGRPTGSKMSLPAKSYYAYRRCVKALRLFCAIAGPGIIVMVADNDAGGITTYTTTGAKYGLCLLWFLVLLGPVAYYVQEMTVRLGAVTKRGHAEAIFAAFGRFWGWFSLLDLVLTDWLTMITEFIGMTAALSIFGLPPWLTVLGCWLIMGGMILSGRYWMWEKITLVFCVVNLIYIPAAFLVQPSLSDIFKYTFIPTLPPGGFTPELSFILMANIGTTIAPWMLFFQQSSVVDKGLKEKDIKFGKVDTAIGAFLTVVVAMVLIIVCGTLLKGQEIDDAAVAARAIMPQSKFIGTVMAIGLFDAGLLGAVCISLASSWAFGEVFGWAHSLNQKIKEAPWFYAYYFFDLLLAGTVVLIPNAPLVLITLTAKSLVIDAAADVRSIESAPEGAVLLQDYIVDKKVLDVEGRGIEVVYDVALALRQNRLFVVGVDVSRRALLRRIGLKWLANFTASITDRITDEIIAWNLVEPLPQRIGSFAGDIRLKVVKEELAKMPPIDVARILEQLTHDQRLALFNGLENGSASDALEELDPKSQRDVIAAVPRDRAARLIDHMTPGQAADVLSVLPWSHANAIMRLLGKEKAAKVRDILESQDERVIDYVSTDCVKLTPDSTALQARQSYQQAQARDAIAYLYVVDAEGKLLGVVGTTDLVMALDETQLRHIGSIAVEESSHDAHGACNLCAAHRCRTRNGSRHRDGAAVPPAPGGPTDQRAGVRGGGAVRLAIADIYSVVRNDRALEDLMSRVNIEPSVISVSWEKVR